MLLCHLEINFLGLYAFTHFLEIKIIILDAFSKNGIKWEKFPNWGASDPNSLVYVCLPSFFKCQNHPEVPKRALQKWGGDI